MHFRGGREAIDKKAYPDIEEFFADLSRVYAEEINALGEAGCTYLQLDEVNMAYLCDDRLREQSRMLGEDPNALPRTYANVINAAIAKRPKTMRAGLHLCRGNSAGAWVAEGGYEPVAEVLFTQINADFYFLEYDSRRAGDFAPLRFLPKNKIAVIGVMTTKNGTLESKDAIKQRIEDAEKYVALDQLCLSPQCGFSPSVEGKAMTEDEQWAKLARVVEVAREVWG
jgi:5-methyltetrahydropteroyltriglutamate--homocysteine methyltransferase